MQRRGFLISGSLSALASWVCKATANSSQKSKGWNGKNALPVQQPTKIGSVTCYFYKIPISEINTPNDAGSEANVSSMKLCHVPPWAEYALIGVYECGKYQYLHKVAVRNSVIHREFRAPFQVITFGWCEVER